MSIKVALEEDLLSVGYTVSHAVRDTRDGVVWLSWPGPSTAIRAVFRDIDP